MSLLIPIEAFDNFREVKDFPADGISPEVLPELVRVVKRLDEREELEPLLRSILTDTEQTPHGPAEIADVIPDTNPTQKRLQNGEAEVSKWPVKVKRRKKVLAKSYRPCRGRESYRVSWQAAYLPPR